MIGDSKPIYSSQAADRLLRKFWYISVPKIVHLFSPKVSTIELNVRGNLTYCDSQSKQLQIVQEASLGHHTWSNRRYPEIRHRITERLI
jgi:hypothetical protein